MIRPINSASNLHRRSACPGSRRLEEASPEQIDNEASSEGKALHGWLAAPIGINVLPDLTSDQKYCVEFCQHTEVELLEKVFGKNKPKILREIELELDGEVFGHADFIAIWKDQAVVLDWKFGRIAVDTAESNLQTRAYAVMVAETYGVGNVLAGIVQPRLSGDQRVTLSQYSLADITQSKLQINGILSACNAPEAVLSPSEAGCRYCRAKATCPALVATSQEIEAIPAGSINVRNAADIYRKAKVVEKHLDAIKSEVFLVVKASIAMGMEVDGLTLKKGAQRRVITDTGKAYDSLSNILSPAAFTAACTVKIGELETAVKTATGKKAKEAKAEMEALLSAAGCLEVREGEPSLVLEKE